MTMVVKSCVSDEEAVTDGGEQVQQRCNILR
jgi:hypothetical protein